jgi:hypothetical protein
MVCATGDAKARSMPIDTEPMSLFLMKFLGSTCTISALYSLALNLGVRFWNSNTRGFDEALVSPTIRFFNKKLHPPCCRVQEQPKALVATLGQTPDQQRPPRGEKVGLLGVEGMQRRDDRTRAAASIRVEENPIYVVMCGCHRVAHPCSGYGAGPYIEVHSFHPFFFPISMFSHGLLRF